MQQRLPPLILLRPFLINPPLSRLRPPLSGMAPTSAIPTFYYVLFGIYEPLLTLTGFLGALADPKKVTLTLNRVLLYLI